jgi:hypothetical protein
MFNEVVIMLGKLYSVYTSPTKITDIIFGDPILKSVKQEENIEKFINDTKQNQDVVSKLVPDGTEESKQRFNNMDCYKALELIHLFRQVSETIDGKKNNITFNNPRELRSSMQRYKVFASTMMWGGLTVLGAGFTLSLAGSAIFFGTPVVINSLAHYATSARLSNNEKLLKLDKDNLAKIAQHEALEQRNIPHDPLLEQLLEIGFDNLKSDVDILKAKLGRKKGKLSDYKRSVNELIKQIDALRIEKSELRQANSGREDQLSQSIDQLAEEKAELERRLETSEAGLAELNERIDALNKEIRESAIDEQSLIEYRQTIETLTEEKEALTERVMNMLTKEKAELANSLLESNKKITDLEEKSVLQLNDNKEKDKGENKVVLSMNSENVNQLLNTVSDNFKNQLLQAEAKLRTANDQVGKATWKKKIPQNTTDFLESVNDISIQLIESSKAIIKDIPNYIVLQGEENISWNIQ